MVQKRKKSIFFVLFSQWRMKALLVVFLVISAVMLNRLYFLQIVRGEYYSALALGQNIKIETLKPRGNIYFQDKAGAGIRLATTNKEAPLIYANPKEIDDKEYVLETLAGILDFEKKERETILFRLSDENSSYALIQKNIDENQTNSVKELGLKGVYIGSETVRIYPSDTVASHVLGFLGFSGNSRVGQYGVEEYYEDVLSGKNNQTSFLNNLLSESSDTTDIVLTVDYGAQFVVEKKLNKLKDKFSADSASAIFMDPKTGEILVMANAPSFNPNSYGDVKDISVFKNNAVQSRYELGSIFKPITMSMGINEKVITPQTTYIDPGSVKIGGYTIRNYDGKARGVQTMTQVLENSLNTGVMFVQEKLGKKVFREYLVDFELDKPTGVDLPGDIAGDIENIKNTNIDINFATASFGQGISFSPLRFLSSISAIANGGVIMEPHIVKKIIQGGKEIEIIPKELGRPIEPITASRVTAMMVSVVENGLHSKAIVQGYTVAAKTGTAQVPDEDGSGYSDKTIHSFIGFAPAYDPRFIGIVMLENPKGIRFSADSVSPTFREITTFLLQYYQVPPN